MTLPNFGPKIVLKALGLAVVAGLLFWYFLPLSFHYKINYSVERGGQVKKFDATYKARVRENSFRVSGEAIPIPVGEDKFVVLSIGGGKPVKFSDWNSHARHVMDHWKLLVYAFRGHFNEESFYKNFSRFAHKNPRATIPKRVLPEMYLVTCGKDQSFKKIDIDDLPALGVSVTRIDISIVNSGVTLSKLSSTVSCLGQLIDSYVFKTDFYS